MHCSVLHVTEPEGCRARSSHRRRRCGQYAPNAIVNPDRRLSDLSQSAPVAIAMSVSENRL